MNEVNWNDMFFMAQIFVFLGAIVGHLEFCMFIIFAEMAIGYYIIFPLFILYGINVLWGEEACFIAILLALGIAIYYFYTKRRWIK